MIHRGPKMDLQKNKLQTGYDIRTGQNLPGHKDVSTTIIYTHILKHGRLGVKSPADFLR